MFNSYSRHPGNCSTPVLPHYLRQFWRYHVQCHHGHLCLMPNQVTSTWHHWCSFCISLNINEMLSSLGDPIPCLQLYARCYDMGAISPSCHPAQARTMEGTLCTVGQMMASLGAPNPWLSSIGKIKFCLQCQLAAYAKQDPPPYHLKPIPLPILQHATVLAYASCTTLPWLT